MVVGSILAHFATMALHALIIVALISTAAAAPWRCCRTADGSTVCFGDVGEPTICPPSITISRAGPPCSGPATVYTPSPCVPLRPVPCPPPCPVPCPAPCPPPGPLPCPMPCPDPCEPSNPCDSCLY